MVLNRAEIAVKSCEVGIKTFRQFPCPSFKMPMIIHSTFSHFNNIAEFVSPVLFFHVFSSRSAVTLMPIPYAYNVLSILIIGVDQDTPVLVVYNS